MPAVRPEPFFTGPTGMNTININTQDGGGGGYDEGAYMSSAEQPPPPLSLPMRPPMRRRPPAQVFVGQPLRPSAYSKSIVMLNS